MSTLKTIRKMNRRKFASSLCFMAAALAFVLAACSTGGSPTTSTPPNTGTSTSTGNQAANYGIGTVPGYQVSLFASAPPSATGPDSLVVDNGHVFVGYQNTTAKDCTDKNSSTIVEFTMDGKVVKTFTMPGHSDGMRADPSTHLLWVTSCEDGNAKMATIDPSSGTVTPYTLPTAPHGGGYDDLYFLNGTTFIVASNPTLDKNGNNTNPAVDKITLSGSNAVLTPVLMGNATATDITAGANNAKITLNEVDPDSLTVDPKGDLVLVDQGGNELVFISNPGTSQQKVSRLSVGSQFDDTVWATSAKGRLLVSDGTSGNTYWISTSSFTPGTIFTQLPDDSGVAGVIGSVDPQSGIVTGLMVGFGKPTGMLFVPDSQS